MFCTKCIKSLLNFHRLFPVHCQYCLISVEVANATSAGNTFVMRNATQQIGSWFCIRNELSGCWWEENSILWFCAENNHYSLPHLREFWNLVHAGAHYISALCLPKCNVSPKVSSGHYWDALEIAGKWLRRLVNCWEMFEAPCHCWEDNQKGIPSATS